MINIGRLMTATPIPVSKKIFFYQPTLRQILDMGEGTYWSLLKLWHLKRSEMISAETPETKDLSDFELWTMIMLHTPIMQQQLIASVDFFLHTKIEFLPLSNTIMIGEGDSSVLLDVFLYGMMQEISATFFDLTGDKKEEQYQETAHMSEHEKRLIAKMKASAEKLDKIKNGEKSTEDQLIKQIISLVAIGKYTFNQVYDMTMVQMIYLLKKCVDVQQYELYTALSPYMDSKKGHTVKHWLDT